MKRMKILLTAAAMFCSLCMTACGSGSDSSSKQSSSAMHTTPAAEATAQEEITQDSGQQKKDSIKVGLICLHDEKTSYDINFIVSLEKAIKNLDISDDHIIVKTDIPEGEECTATIEQLVSMGCNIIMADSFDHEPFMLEAAKAHPDVQFCHATGTRAHTEKLDNFHNAFASICEGRYLSGIAAGMKLNEMIADGKITEEQAVTGYVGAFPYASVISGYTAFYLGAKSVCPSATMKVTFTGSWYAEKKENDAANLLIKEGCVLISQHADSMGAPTACEKAGVPNISYNCSNSATCPNTSIVASKINWTPYFEYIINCVMDNEKIDLDWVGTISNGAVQLTEVNERAAAKGTQEAIDEAIEKLNDGTLHVFDTSAFTVEGKTITTYMADVDTDENFTPDTEAISDGYFYESEYRSAPYFNINIDGITLLDTAY